MTMQARGVAVPRESTTLADLLDRVLDKGLVVAGDISISLANVELLTIRIRLLVCSIDKAEQIGLNWWKYDRELTRRDGVDQTAIGRLEKRIAELERELERSRKPGRQTSCQLNVHQAVQASSMSSTGSSIRESSSMRGSGSDLWASTSSPLRRESSLLRSTPISVTRMPSA